MYSHLNISSEHLKKFHLSENCENIEFWEKIYHKSNHLRNVVKTKKLIQVLEMKSNSFLIYSTSSPQAKKGLKN